MIRVSTVVFMCFVLSACGGAGSGTNGSQPPADDTTDQTTPEESGPPEDSNPPPNEETPPQEDPNPTPPPSDGMPPAIPAAFAAGLTYVDGIEPGDAAVCEAPAGNRCWYVDAAAVDGGDGSHGNPYNSFERVAGYWSGPNYMAGLVRGGDYIYVKGTFSASRHVEGVRNMDLNLGRGVQGGTKERPTVIKSWRGQARAVFDGEYIKKDLIRVSALGNDPFGAVVIQNIELTRADGRGIIVNQHVKYAEIHNIYVHDTFGDNNIGTGGGIALFMRDNLHEYVVRNCVFHGNRRNQTANSNNVGGLSIISEAAAETGSKVTIYESIFSDEVGAIRHKHSGNIEMEAYHNIIYDSRHAFYVRAYRRNDIHHNVIFDVETAFFLSAENQQGDALINIYNNTVYNARDLVDTGFDTSSFARAVHVSENIFYNPAATSPIVLGRYAGTAFDRTGWTSRDNLFFIDPNSSSVVIHLGTPFSFAAGMAYLGDASSFQDDPKFVDVANDDVRLAEDSVARGAGSGGGDLGAMP